MSLPHKHWGRIHRGLSLLLTVVWVGAGATKLAGLAAFEGVLETHDVLPYAAVGYAWLLPVAEVAVGTVIFVGGGRPLRSYLLRFGAFASVVLLLSFSAYVLRVDAEVFKAAGCGCIGGLGITDVMGSPTRGVVVAVDMVLAAMSVALLRIPALHTAARE